MPATAPLLAKILTMGGRGGLFEKVEKEIKAVSIPISRHIRWGTNAWLVEYGARNCKRRAGDALRQGKLSERINTRQDTSKMQDETNAHLKK